MKTSTVQARMDPALKQEAESVLAQIGLNSTSAITMFYTQIKLCGGLPFAARIPNAETRQAMADIDKGIGLTGYNSVDDLWKTMEKE